MTRRLDDTRGNDWRCSVKRAKTMTEQVLNECVLLREGGGGVKVTGSAGKFREQRP